MIISILCTKVLFLFNLWSNNRHIFNDFSRRFIIYGHFLRINTRNIDIDVTHSFIFIIFSLLIIFIHTFLFFHFQFFGVTPYSFISICFCFFNLFFLLYLILFKQFSLRILHSGLWLKLLGIHCNLFLHLLIHLHKLFLIHFQNNSFEFLRDPLKKLLPQIFKVSSSFFFPLIFLFFPFFLFKNFLFFFFVFYLWMMCLFQYLFFSLNSFLCARRDKRWCLRDCALLHLFFLWGHQSGSFCCHWRSWRSLQINDHRWFLTSFFGLLPSHWFLNLFLHDAHSFETDS